MSSSSGNLKAVGLLACLLLSVSISVVAFEPPLGLEVGYYNNPSRCPLAESIIRNLVNEEVSRNPGMAAGLVHLQFQDCFNGKSGCDASVLLDGTPEPASEGPLQESRVIHAAKALLEEVCPTQVSCADILAFAARDSSFKAGNIWWDVPAGRKDGPLSSGNTETLPPTSAFFNVSQNLKAFTARGMSLDEMVLLSGAHSIGTSPCGAFTSRIYPDIDPTMDPGYAKFLRTICLPNTPGIRAYLDIVTPNRLDNVYYENLKKNIGLLFSDQIMMNDPESAGYVVKYAEDNELWSRKFADAMVHLSYVGVLVGDQGEVREDCHFENSRSLLRQVTSV